MFKYKWDTKRQEINIGGILNNFFSGDKKSN